MGRHDFLDCIALIALRVGRRLHTDLSSKGGVKILPGIALRDHVTLHSFDFTKYRLWTSLFQCGTIVNGQILVCSFDLAEYHLWKIYIWMFLNDLCFIEHLMTLNEDNRHCGCTRLVL